MKSFSKVFVMLCLIMAGASSVSAQTQTFEVNDIEYSVSTFNGLDGTTYYLTHVTDYKGSADTLVINDHVIYGITTYTVDFVGGGQSFKSINISTVKTLIINGNIDIEADNMRPTFNCPLLQDVIFKGASPNLRLPFERYFGQRQGIIAHVGDKTPDEIFEMKGGSDGWHGFTDIVSYNEVEEEPVNVYVTVEEDSPACSAMFRINSNQYLYGAGSEVYSRKKHASLSFFVADGTYGKTKNVYVNGKDVFQEMEADPEDSPFYSAENVKKYTIQDLKTDTYIRIVPEDKYDLITLGVASGGKVVFEKNGTNTVQNNNFMDFRLDKGQHIPLTIIPDEGYEFDKFWWNGISLIGNMGDQITSELQGDGTCIYNVSGGGKMVVTFKPVDSSSGSSISAFDLNGDGYIDVSDIDKLIEEINKR